MTSLTDKMEGLRRDTPNEFDIGSERSTPKIIRDNGFNQGVDASIALAKAEEAVVDNWEVEYDTKFADKDIGYATDFGDYQSFEYSGVYDDVKAYINNLLTAKDREIEEAVAEERARVVGLIEEIRGMREESNEALDYLQDRIEKGLLSSLNKSYKK